MVGRDERAMISAGLLKQRATIQRGGETADATGFLDPWASPTTVATNVPCNLQPRAERSKVYSEGRVINGSQIVYFNLPRDVVVSDRLVIGSNTYDVRKVDNAAGRDHHLEVGVEPFQPQRA